MITSQLTETFVAPPTSMPLSRVQHLVLDGAVSCRNTVERNDALVTRAKNGQVLCPAGRVIPKYRYGTGLIDLFVLLSSPRTGADEGPAVGDFMEKVVFAAGDTVLSEGEQGRTAFLVISGKVEVVIGSGSKAKSLATLRAGEVFGEMSLLEPGPRSATVRALDRTECLVTSYDDFMSTIQEDPQKAVAFMRTLVSRLRQTNEMLSRLDPQKRGIRDIVADMQKSVSLQTADMGRGNWYEWGTV